MGDKERTTGTRPGNGGEHGCLRTGMLRAVPALDAAGAPAPLASCDAPTVRAALEGLGHPFGGARGYALPRIPRHLVPWVRPCLVPEHGGAAGEGPAFVQVGTVAVPAVAVARHLVVFADRMPTAPRAVVETVVRRTVVGPRPLPAAAAQAWRALRAVFCTITLVGPAGPARWRAVSAADLRLDGAGAARAEGPYVGLRSVPASPRTRRTPPVRGRLPVAWRTPSGAPNSATLAVDPFAWVG